MASTVLVVSSSNDSGADLCAGEAKSEVAKRVDWVPEAFSHC